MAADTKTTRKQLYKTHSSSTRLQSYTGADIKVLVHIPDNERLQADKAKIEELEREQIEVGTRLRDSVITRGSTNIEAEISRKKAEQQNLREDNVKLQNTISVRDDERTAAIKTEEEILRGGKHRTSPAQQNQDLDGDILQRIVNNNNRIGEIDTEISRLRSSNRSQIRSIDTEAKSLTNLANEVNRLNNSLHRQDTTKELADLQTLSYQVFRDKTPVRAIGHSYPRAFVRGSRTIAGTMIFTLFDRDVLLDLMGTGNIYDFQFNTSTTTVLDQMPPLDLTVTFNNELGQGSYLKLYGVEFMSNGVVMGVEDLMIESTVQFIARNYDPMRPFEDLNKIAITSPHTTNITTGSNVWVETEEYQRYKNQFNPFL